MKTTTTIMVLLFLLIGSPTAQAQDLLDALKQTAQMHNEQNNTDNSNDSTDEMEREAEAWWNQELDENAGILNGLDDPIEKCMALIILWSHSYLNLKEQIKSTENCKLKYDLYGMQLLQLTAGQTIIYCNEKLMNLTTEESNIKSKDFMNNYFENMEEYVSIHHHDAEFSYKGSGNKTAFAKMIIWVMEEVDCLKNCHDPWEIGGTFKQLAYELNPINFSVKVIGIGEAMEALGCGG
ncbi:hypothetical protein [Maribacter polysaccharolyticus]|uniref:hypothetical protein n=1 Tax=Maribacter polysaccharolyticus TaxID=3020831 RepID=UPI00237F1C9D|nr:hypothetical protein [Maribacter polysaccharolyticus]MDE3742346.1 hypothetical protein [Maribacter polysaccharolyticus]